jgi:hypothetical protein
VEFNCTTLPAGGLSATAQ